jgi:hypothetical protein
MYFSFWIKSILGFQLLFDRYKTIDRVLFTIGIEVSSFINTDVSPLQLRLDQVENWKTPISVIY